MADDKRTVLLEAGIDLLAEKTFSEVSMDQVAERSGLSKPMVYYYFGNKEGYFRALADHVMSLVTGMMRGLFSEEATLRENLRRYVELRMGFLHENPRMTRAFLNIMYDPNVGLLIDDARERLDSIRTDFIDPVFDLAIERGEIDPGVDRYLVLMVVNSTLIGHTMKVMAGIPEDLLPDPSGMIDMLFDGVATASGKEGRR